MAPTQNQRLLFVKCLHHDCRPIPHTGCVHFVRYSCFPAYESIVEIFRYIRMVLCFVRLRFSCSSSRLFLWKPCNAAKWLQKRSKNTAQNGCGATLRVRRPHFEAMLGSSAGCAWCILAYSPTTSRCNCDTITHCDRTHAFMAPLFNCKHSSRRRHRGTNRLCTVLSSFTSHS